VPMEEITVKKSDRLLGWMRTKGIRQPAIHLSERFGVTRSTIYEWLKQLDAGDSVRASDFIAIVREIDPAAVDQIFR